MVSCTIPFPFPCLMCMCLDGVRVPTSGVNGGHIQCTVYSVCMHDVIHTHTHTHTHTYTHTHAHTHTDLVLTAPVAPDALLPADSEAVQTETNCPAAA